MPVVTTYMRAFNSKKLDPYPVEVLKRVDRPTTMILDDQVKRVDERESRFGAPVLVRRQRLWPTASAVALLRRMDRRLRRSPLLQHDQVKVSSAFSRFPHKSSDDLLRRLGGHQ
jgi:hypothetical protein